MDNLRLILIVAGLVVIAAIYCWERLQNRNLKRRQTTTLPAEREGMEPHVSGGADMDDDLAAELANLNDFISGQAEGSSAIVVTRDAALTHAGVPVLDHETDPSSLDDRQRGDQSLKQGDDDIDPDSVIALYIVGGDGRTMTGADIMAALSELGFEFGAMNIFHHFGNGPERGDQPWFSLLNMYEPGYFDVDNMDHFSTNGLSVFTRLSPGGNAEVFTLMLETVRRLADRLDAGIQGPDHRPLTQETVNRILHHINEYGR
jgi:FtsZ-interacting cell division protein ZipA